MKYRLELAKAIADAMKDDPTVVVLGESVADPRGIFGTTLEAAQSFPERVIETPLSETMLTGACLGMALEGWKPIYVHARTDFLFLTMEHLVNTIAKWRSVHGGRNFNLVLRALVGRGWGQGPGHSQAIHAMFAHVPGLRVLYPVDPKNLAHWMGLALTGDSPAVVLEPRRMYEVESLDYPHWDDPDVYLVTFGDVVLDAAKVATELGSNNIKVQVHPIEDVTALVLPQSDAPIVVADTGHLSFGASAEVVARLAEQGNHKVKRVGPPFVPLPTSAPLEKEWYPSTDDISSAICSLLGIKPIQSTAEITTYNAFKGPF